LRHAKGVLSARRNRPRGGLISFEHEEDQEMIRGIVSPTQGYSVPASFANRPVSLRAYPDRLVVVLEARLWRDAAEGQILCEHMRVIQRSHQLPPRTIYDWRHYLAVLQRKPGALRNGAPFAEFPPAFKQLQDLMLRKPGGDREMVDILALVLHHVMPKACFQHDEQAVLVAVEMALARWVSRPKPMC
jgi:hypothetical protein